MFVRLQLLAQESAAPSIPIIERIDEDALAAFMIISVILGFIALITIVGMLTNMTTRIFTHRENNRMVTDLINRGYSTDEIQKLMALGSAEVAKLDHSNRQASSRRSPPLAASK